MDEVTMKIGMLLEAAQVQQASAEAVSIGLRTHIEGMDAVVRDEIRRTMVEELTALVGASRRAAAAFKYLERTWFGRYALWLGGLTVLCAYSPLMLTRLTMPSVAELERLETRKTDLVREIASLEKRGGGVQFRECGQSKRLCLRVDKSSKAYGANADYYVVADR